MEFDKLISLTWHRTKITIEWKPLTTNLEQHYNSEHMASTKAHTKGFWLSNQGPWPLLKPFHFFLKWKQGPVSIWYSGQDRQPWPTCCQEIIEEVSLESNPFSIHRVPCLHCIHGEKGKIRIRNLDDAGHLSSPQ